jgi:hypothetical protein
MDYSKVGNCFIDIAITVDELGILSCKIAGYNVSWPCQAFWKFSQLTQNLFRSFP